jgi:hypothetical protein
MNVELRVSARGDTTDIEVLRREVPIGASSDSVRVMSSHAHLTGGDPPTAQLTLNVGEAGRLVVGVDPVKLSKVRRRFERVPVLRSLFK